MRDPHRPNVKILRGKTHIPLLTAGKGWYLSIGFQEPAQTTQEETCEGKAPKGIG